MDSLKDLTDFLKTRPSGSGFGELKTVFGDEAELKNFIKIGLENGVIQKEGEKRGTKYYVGTLTAKAENIDDDGFRPASGDIDIYLKSDKPCPGQPVIVKVTEFGEAGKSIAKFLTCGIIIESYLIAYDKVAQKNVVLHHEVKKIFNKISFQRDGRQFLFRKFHAKGSKIENETFSCYEDFREHVLVNIN